MAHFPRLIAAQSNLLKFQRYYSASCNLSRDVTLFWWIFLELNSKRLCTNLEKENKSRCLVITFSVKREIRPNFLFVVVQRQQRNLQKKKKRDVCLLVESLLFPVLIAVAAITVSAPYCYLESCWCSGWNLTLNLLVQTQDLSSRCVLASLSFFFSTQASSNAVHGVNPY